MVYFKRVIYVNFLREFLLERDYLNSSVHIGCGKKPNYSSRSLENTRLKKVLQVPLAVTSVSFQMAVQLTSVYQS